MRTEKDPTPTTINIDHTTYCCHCFTTALKYKAQARRVIQTLLLKEWVALKRAFVF